MKNRKMIQKKHLFYLGCLTAVAAVFGITGYLGSTTELVAKEDDGTPIVVDKGSEYEYELPYDAAQLWEPALLGDSTYNNKYVQNENQGNIIEKIKLSTYWEQGDNAWNVGTNTILPLPNGNFVVIVLKTSVPSAIKSQQILLYVDKAGNVIDTYLGDVGAGVGVRFQTFLDFSAVDDGNGNYSFLISGKNASEVATLFNGKVVDEKLEVTTINSFPEFASSNVNTEGIKSGNDRKYPNMLSLGGGTSLVSESVSSKLFVINYVNGGFLANDNPITIKNPGFEYNMTGYSHFLGFQELANNSDGSVLAITRSSVYTAPVNTNPVYAMGISLFDSDFQNEQQLYTTGLVKNDYMATIVRELAIGDNQFVFLSSNEADSLLLKIDTSKGTVETIKTFPPKTSILFTRAPNNSYVSYIGYIESKWDELNGFSVQEKSLISGLMDPENFSIKSIISSPISGSISINKMISLGLVGEQEYFAIAGISTSSLDQMIPEALEDETANKHFFGTLFTSEDYAPAIELATSSIQVNNDTLNESNKDSQLLTGKDNNKAYKVYDVKDSNNTIDGVAGQTWLESRINRNPNALTNPIDWDALGFEDNGKVGANRVTYFVTDSQKQTTSTSRIVNKIDSHTVVNKEGALAAYNFAITLDDLVNLTDTSLRNSEKYARLTAWDLDTGEDILPLSAAEGVEIDADQLADIKAATGFGIYPLTFKLNYGSEYKEVKISVFVSKYEPIDDYVYDLEPVSMPWDVSRDISGEDYPNSEFSKDGIHVYTAYKVSTGEKIDENNPNYQLIGDVTDLNACDPDPNDYTATEAVKVPVSIWTRGTNPTKEVDLPNTPDTTVYYRTENLQVSFVDWNFESLYDVEGNQLQAAGVTLKNQIVGKQSALKNDTQVVAAIDGILLKGYEKEDYYLADKATKLATDTVLVELNDGNGAVYYVRFKGLLEIVSVPSLDFGLHNTTAAWGGNLREDNPEVTGSLVISDTRADTTKNWTLKAELSEPLTSIDGSVVIPDAIRYKRSGQAEFVLGTEKQVMLTNDAGTFGTFNVSDTWGSTKDSDGFKFEAPAAKVKKLTSYQATIKYTLSDTYEP